MQLLRSAKALLLCAGISSAVAMSCPTVVTEGQAAPNFIGRKDCQFQPPVDWRDSTLSWDGECQGGSAHGLGVIRIHKESNGTQLFFGRLNQGRLQLGVIEIEGGYLAGRFVDGKLQAHSTKDDIADAFHDASSAAAAYSQSLDRTGSQRLSIFYLKKSQEFERSTYQRNTSK